MICQCGSELRDPFRLSICCAALRLSWIADRAVGETALRTAGTQSGCAARSWYAFCCRSPRLAYSSPGVSAIRIASSIVPSSPTTWGVGVGDGEGVGEGMGDAGEADGRPCMSAWAAPHAVRAKARTGAIIRMPGTRIIAAGFYEFRRV